MMNEKDLPPTEREVTNIETLMYKWLQIALEQSGNTPQMLFQKLRDLMIEHKDEIRPDMEELGKFWLSFSKLTRKSLDGKIIFDGKNPYNMSDEEFEMFKPMMDESGEVFSESFAPYLDLDYFENEDTLILAMLIVHFGKQLRERKKDQITINEALEQFSTLYEFLAKLIIFIAKLIYSKRENKVLSGPSLNSALRYLKKIDKRFGKLFNKYVREEFRHAYAHKSWIPKDADSFYIFTRGHKKRLYTLIDLMDATLNLLIFQLVLFTEIFLDPFFTQLLLEKSSS